jgi:hypothetical protein
MQLLFSQILKHVEQSYQAVEICLRKPMRRIYVRQTSLDVWVIRGKILPEAHCHALPAIDNQWIDFQGKLSELQPSFGAFPHSLFTSSFFFKGRSLFGKLY